MGRAPRTNNSSTQGSHKKHTSSHPQCKKLSILEPAIAMFRDLFTPGVYSAPGSRNQYYKNFSLKFTLQICFFFSWSAFSCKKNQFSRGPGHTSGLVSKFEQILQ